MSDTCRHTTRSFCCRLLWLTSVCVFWFEPLHVHISGQGFKSYKKNKKWKSAAKIPRTADNLLTDLSWSWDKALGIRKWVISRSYNYHDFTKYQWRHYTASILGCCNEELVKKNVEQCLLLTSPSSRHSRLAGLVSWRQCEDTIIYLLHKKAVSGAR